MKVIPYTYVNLGVVGTALALGSRSLQGMAFSNSVAVLLSFYAGLAIDPTARDRLMERWRMSYREFVVRDFVVHVLPVILTAYAAWRRNGHSSKVPAGFVSLALHLGWLACVSRPDKPYGDLSHVYVSLTPLQWKVIWGVAAVAHLGALPAIGYLRRRSAPLRPRV